MPDEIVGAVDGEITSTDALEAPASQDSEPASSTGDSGSTADSSPAEGVNNEPKSALDAVKAALAKTAGAEAAPATEKVDGQAPGEVETPAPDTPEQGDDGLLDDDKIDPKLAADTQKRIRGLLRVGKQLRREMEPLKSRVADLEPKAKHYEQLEAYARKSGFSQEYFTDLLHMGRLMIEDPVVFHQSFRDKWAEIEQMVGVRLPEDLQKRVDAGQLDRAGAQELALARTQRQLNDQRTARQRQESEQERVSRETADREREVEQFSNDVGNSVSGWERQWKGTDPDYAVKQPFVSDKIRAMLAEKPPTSVQEVLAICNEARKQVSAQLRTTLPARSPVRPNPSSISVGTKGQPKSALEAVRMRQEGTF